MSDRDFMQEQWNRERAGQPSTRTAEPRTKAWAHEQHPFDPDNCLGCDQHDRLAEAAAPAGLDVDVLQEALDNTHLDVEYVGPGDGPLGEAYIDLLAAEYARLLQEPKAKRQAR